MTERPAIRRIAVALDASSASHLAAEAAAELAARLGAELLGVFVEDLDLLHATALPFTAEVDVFSATVRTLDVPETERRLRGQAERARRRLEEVAARSRVQCQFRVLRGQVVAELSGLATEADLMSLSRGRHRRRLGSTARELLAGGRGRLLLLPPGHGSGRPVAVLYDGGEAARHALAAAAGMLVPPEEGEELVVVLPAADEEEAARLEAEAAEALSAVGVGQRRFQRLLAGEGRSRALERALARLGEGLLVLPAGDWIAGEDLLALVDRLERAVLLIR